MQHISQGGTGTGALRQVLHFSPKRGGISSCLKESTAYVLHIAYKCTPLFLLLALSYSLPLSVTPHIIRSAPFPFWPYTLRLCFHYSIFSSASLSISMSVSRLLVRQG